MSSEEGELPEAEEGELPDQEQESGEASGFEEPEPDGFEPHHYTTAYRQAPAFPPPFPMRDGPGRPGPGRDYGPNGPSLMPLRSPERFGPGDRRGSHHSTGMPPPSSQPTRDEKSLKEISERQAALREEREKEELSSSLKELTRYVSVQDAMRSLDTVCTDLKSAIKKLEKLAKKTKKSKQDDIELFPDCFQFSRRILEGLKSVHVVCGTSGISQTVSMEVAKKLFKTAMNYRHDILSSSQKRELESWVRSSKVLKSLIEDRKGGVGDKSGAGAGATTSRETSALPDGLTSPLSPQAAEPPRSYSPSPDKDQLGPSVSSPPGVESTSQLNAAQSGDALTQVKAQENGHTPASAPGHAPPPPLPASASPTREMDTDPPPPPPSTTPVEVPEPIEVATAPGQQYPQGHKAVGGSSSRPSSAFKFKIVVESTAADIRKGTPHGPEGVTEAACGAEGAAPPAVGAAMPPPPASALAGEPARSGSCSQSKRSHHSRNSDDGSGSRAAKKPRSGEQEDVAAGSVGGGTGGGRGERGREEDSSRHGGGSGTGRHSDRDQSRRDDRRESRYRSSSRDHSHSERGKDPSSRRGGHSPPPTAPPAPPESPISDDEPYNQDGHATANGHGLEDGYAQQQQQHQLQELDLQPPPPKLPQSVLSSLSNGMGGKPGEEAGLAESVPQLLGQGKLVLVLDLDHTLMNTARFGVLSSELVQVLTQQMAAEAEMLPEASAELYRLDQLNMWAKLRPGVREFLARAKDRFELWVHSNGTKSTADVLVRLVDPTGSIFGTRVIAQGSADGEESGGSLACKRLLSSLEGRLPIAVILDDSSAAWAQDRRSLFMVERYMYFPSCRRRYGMEGRSLIEVDRDECPDRGMLMTASGVLHRLHNTVFTVLNSSTSAPASISVVEPSLPIWDLRNIMGNERRKVLAGVSLVFSRLVPLEQDPKSHSLWRLAEQFGATCSTAASESTTHVIATARGTEKTFWAVQNGKPVVSPAWLECSCVMWRRANEDRFTVPA